MSPEDEQCEDYRMYTLGSTAKFCCPSEGDSFPLLSPLGTRQANQSDTYKNCEWKDGDYCTETCPSDKVMITQRPGIVNPDDDTDTKTCSDGFVKLCCDPPDATTDFPVDPEDLFEYPDDDDVSYYYNVEENSNNEGKPPVILATMLTSH